MDTNLVHSAEKGHIDDLYASIRRDPYLLNKIEAIPFTDTPLHLAVINKQTHFAKELASLKPSFVRKLNQGGLSPVHLASADGSVEMVWEFLRNDHSVGTLKGRNKKTPLHWAAATGMVGVLDEILKACPNSLGELTVEDETATHLAVKHGSLDALKILLKASMSSKEDLLNWKDDEGNTLLHLAARKRNFQMIDELLNAKNLNGVGIIEVNAKNTNNETALDIIKNYKKDSTGPESRAIQVLLEATTSSDLPVYIGTSTIRIS